MIGIHITLLKHVLKVEVSSNVKIDPIVFSIAIMLRQFHSDSTGHFWHSAEFENVANPDFKNLKHLQNPGHLFLTAPSMSLLPN